MLYLTRRERFSAAHRLWKESFDKEKNEDIYGECSNFHGHNYVLEVTVKGKNDPESSFVINLKTLSKIIREHIISKLDHKFLNDIEMLEGKTPTSENLSLVIWEELKDKIPNAELFSVKIYETENNCVEYRGED
ncbi:MAG: 6-carboxytetrahydropterin synthase [Ignavibacteriales bacterium]|nr:6-carboxytetrahydropterin synthase [Ignavibacteriales bacterium]